jgi:hypothetical protein
VHQRAEKANFVGGQELALAYRTTLHALLGHVKALVAANAGLVLGAALGTARGAAIQGTIATQ